MNRMKSRESKKKTKTQEELIQDASVIAEGSNLLIKRARRN